MAQIHSATQLCDDTETQGDHRNEVAGSNPIRFTAVFLLPLPKFNICVM